VTGFGKTVPVHTRNEIHFIAYYNSHTQGLSRHRDTIAIDKKVCFYRRPFANPMKPCWTNLDPVGPLGCINRVACGPKLFHSTSALHMVWSGLLWASVWPTVHTTWLPVSESIVNPPSHPLICGICDVSGSVQNISQNQPVHPAAIKVSVMIAISLLSLFLLQILRGYYQA